MNKNTFANVESIQNELLKKSKAMKEIKEVLLVVNLPRVMYDNKTDSQVFMTDLKSSTLHRYIVMLNKLLKYANDNDKLEIRKKLTETERYYNEALQKETAAAVAKKKEQNKKYWIKQAKLKAKENKNNTSDVKTNINIDEPKPVIKTPKKFLPSTAQTSGNIIEFKFDKDYGSVTLNTLNGSELDMEIDLMDDDSVKDTRTAIFSAGYGNAARKLVDAIIIECSKELNIYTDIKEPSGVTVDLYPWRNKN